MGGMGASEKYYDPFDHYYTYYLMKQYVPNNARLIAAFTDLLLAYGSLD